MQLERLRGRKVCERLQRLGHVWKGKTMMVRWLHGTPRHPAADPAVRALYIGTLASTKLDKSAVRRNRMRRRCREAWRTLLREEPETFAAQLLIAPRSSSLKAPFADIQADVRQFLHHLRTCPKPSPAVPFSSSR